MTGFNRREFMKLGIASAGCFALSGPFGRLLSATEIEELAKGVSSFSGKLL